MSKKKAPAFQFYPGDWLGSQRVTLMSLEEEGAYIRLLSYCWQHGSIPREPEKIARLIGKGASITLAQSVATMFQPPLDNGSMVGDVLVHDRLAAQRDEYDAWLEKSRRGGKASAEARRRNRVEGEPPLQPPFQPNGNTTSSSTSTIDIERERTPLLEEVLAFAQTIGLAAWRAEDWWNEMESVNWLDHRGRPVHKWQNSLARVKTNWSAMGSPMQPISYSKTQKDSKPERRSKYEF